MNRYKERKYAFYLVNINFDTQEQTVYYCSRPFNTTFTCQKVEQQRRWSTVNPKIKFSVCSQYKFLSVCYRFLTFLSTTIFQNWPSKQQRKYLILCFFSCDSSFNFQNIICSNILADKFSILTLKLFAQKQFIYFCRGPDIGVIYSFSSGNDNISGGSHTCESF